MFDKNYAIREFLTNCGFVQPDMNGESGTLYVYLLPSEKARFEVKLASCTCEAYYPDFQYNKTNTYATKDTVVSIKWKDEDDPETVIENLKDFFTKILNILGRV